MTKEKFNKLSIQDKQKLFDTDPDTFKQLAEGGN